MNGQRHINGCWRIFLDIMINKQPSVVVTDSEETTREAIKAVFPYATHRLCLAISKKIQHRTSRTLNFVWNLRNAYIPTLIMMNLSTSMTWFKSLTYMTITR